ncbi:MAG: MarR family winged helix-turn-helix transcriptional regulator [Spirochaetales bacterium]|nr:MarR family winged helix-turn-helix transcriptional regulator [Spirochaetales bacterium]
MKSASLYQALMDYMPYHVLHIDSLVHRSSWKGRTLRENHIQVMLMLFHRGSSTPKHLSRSLGIQKGSLSHVLHWLRQENLVEKYDVQEDERSYNVRLTAQGRDFVFGHHQKCAQSLEQLLNSMSSKERLRVMQGWETLQHYLERKEPIK